MNTTLGTTMGSNGMGSNGMGSNIFFQIFNVLGSLITGIALGVAVVSYMVYPIKSSKSTNNDSQTDDEESSEEEVSDVETEEESDELVESDFDIEVRKKRELVTYNNKLFDELSEMTTRELSLTDLEELHSKVVEEMTPYGKVIMTYNHATEAFWWNSSSPNSDSIPYKTLDAVARVFSITHDCKKICINYKEEFLREKKRVIELLESDAASAAEASANEVGAAAGAGAGANEVGANEVGAGAGKGANEVGTIDDQKYAIIVNNKNRFINKELNDLHKKIEVKVSNKNIILDDDMGKMSYADFKKNYKEIINKVKEE